MAAQRGSTQRSEPPSESALIGREMELARLTEAARQVALGQGRVVVVAGEAGAGKTSLARSFLRSHPRRSDCLFSGRGYQVESQIPYAALTDAFQGHLRSLAPAAIGDLLTTCGPELARVFPALRLPDDTHIDRTAAEAGARKAVVFDAFFRFFRGLIPPDGFLILFLDDLHWADTASLELWHFLAHSSATERILLIGSYRSEEAVLNATLEHVLTSVRRLDHGREVILSPLTPDQTVTLVQRALGRPLPLTPEFAGWIQNLAQGNPLFTSEIVRALMQSGRLREVGGYWQAEIDQPLHLPQTVRDVFRSRLEVLGEDAKTVLTVAAVLGGGLEFGVLQSTTGLDDQRLLAALDELQDLQILVEHQVHGVSETEFAHPLMRETLYEHLSPVHRGHLHGQIARSLTELADRAPGIPASRLAFHYSQAADLELRQQAIPYLMEAGEEALNRFANREAIGYLRTALSLLGDRSEEAARRLHVLERIGLGEERVGTLDQAVASWHSAVYLAEEIGDVTSMARLHRRIGRALWQLGDEQGALTEFQTGLAALAADPGSIEVADLHQELAQAYQRLGRIDPALEEAERAVAAAIAQGDEGVAARAYTALVAVHGFRGRFKQASEFAQRALDLVERHHWPRIGWRVHYLLAVFATHHGQTELARLHADQSLALAVEIGAPVLTSWPLSALAALDWQTGEWESGIENVERAIALDRQTGQLSTLPRVLTYAASLYLGRGDVARARDNLAEALELLDRLVKRDVHMRCLVYGGLAWHHLSLGEFGAAEEAAHQAIDLVDTRQAYPLYLLHRSGLPALAEAQIELGNLEGATATLDRLHILAGELEHDPAVAADYRLRGRVLVGRGQVEAGRSDLATAVALWRRLAQPYEIARALRDQGLTDLSAGDRSGGAHLQEAIAIFGGLGAEREAAAVRQMLRQHGIRVQRRPGLHGRGSGALTERELEIARLAAEGLTNREIADRLYISPLTAETHLRNILRKLNLHSRAQLADHLEFEKSA